MAHPGMAELVSGAVYGHVQFKAAIDGQHGPGWGQPLQTAEYGAKGVSYSFEITEGFSLLGVLRCL